MVGKWRVAAGAAYVLAYVLLDALSYVQPLLKLGITPWSPQAGLTVAFMLWQGWRAAPWTTLAALLAEVIVRDAPGAYWAVACSSVAIGAGYGALAALLERSGVAFPIRTARAAAQLSVATAGAAIVVAAGYVAAFTLSGALPAAQAGTAVARYWVGDLNGVITMTPLLLALPSLGRLPAALRGHGLLVAAQAAGLALTIGLVFGLVSAAGHAGEMRFVYALFVPVVWITSTWGVTGAALATLAIQIGMMSGVGEVLSPASLVEAQFLLVTLGATTLLLGGVVDERERALRDVAAREAEQRALLAAAPDAVLSTDPDGRVLSANPAAQRMFETSSTPMPGTPAAQWLPHWIARAPSGRARLRGRRSDGRNFPAEIAWVQLDAPARAGYLLVVRDVTEREHAQAQLRERDAALARALRFAMAGELATALTHELNQPIMALVSYLRAVEILATPLRDAEPRLQETLSKASRQAQRASDVLRRLRSFYLTGTASTSTFELRTVLDEVAEAFADRLAAAGVTLSTDVATEVRVRSDRTHLQMILHNLVGNALEAMPPAGGERRIEVRAAESSGIVRVVVEDTGSGIPLEIQSEVFEPFVTSKPNGLGLGLAIARSLVRAQGGDLRLEASSEAGTRFVIELPADAKGQAAA